MTRPNSISDALPRASNAVMRLNPTLFKNIAIAPVSEPKEAGIAFTAVMTPTTDESRLNKTEAAFLAWLRANHWENIAIQAITLKLGDDCRYTPDFTAIKDGKLVAFEVKGFWRDDARVKIKTAARQFRWLKFIAVTKAKGGGWDEESINP